MRSRRRGAVALAALVAAALATPVLPGAATAAPTAPPAASAAPSAAAPPASPSAAVSLTLGTVLPDTGSLRAYGPATQAAVLLAVQDANGAGGVMGERVTLLAGDSGGVGDGVFARELARLADAQAIVGPLSSQLVLDDLAAIAGRTLVSPATASPALTGRIARVVPTESLQGAALASMAKRERAGRLVVVGHRDDRATIQAALDRARDIGLDRVSVVYAQDDPSRIAARIVRTSADALLLASAAQATAILRQLLPRGMPATVLLTQQAATGIQARSLRPGTLDGAQSIELDLRVPRGLTQRIRAIAPQARQTAYAPQAYDAAAVAILAAEQAGRLTGSITPAVVRAALPAVTSVGEACDTIPRCLRLLRQGVDIVYVGYTGPFDLGTDGDPRAARYLARTYSDDNRPGSGTRLIRYP